MVCFCSNLKSVLIAVLAIIFIQTILCLQHSSLSLARRIGYSFQHQCTPEYQLQYINRVSKRVYSNVHSVTETDTYFSYRVMIKTRFSAVFSKTLKFTTALFSSLLLLFSGGLSSNARAALKSSNVYDIYGRMPHDDWLFTSWRLTDPNLLKRSYVECVSNL